MEHSSGVNLLLALWAVGKTSRQKGDPRLPAWAWLLGSGLGLAIMLLGPGYFYVPDNHTATYRALYLGGLRECLTACVRNSLRLSTYYLNSNGLPLCLGCAATLWLTRQRRFSRGNRFMALLWGLSSGYILFCMGHGLDIYYGKETIVQHILGLGLLVLLAGVWAVSVWQLGPGPMREKLLLCLGFGLVALTPMLIVNPVPERVVLQSYVFFAGAALLCAGQIGRELPTAWGQKTLAVMASILVLTLGSVYTSAGHLARLREAHILRQIHQGQTHIQIFTIEYDYILDRCQFYPLYSSNLAGYPVTFEEISQSVWLNQYGEA